MKRFVFSILVLCSIPLWGSDKTAETKEESVELDIKSREGRIVSITRPKRVIYRKYYWYPRKERFYTVVTVEMALGKSLSVMDYRLKVSDKLYPCLGLAVGQEAFGQTELVTVPDEKKRVDYTEKSGPKVRVLDKVHRIRIFYEVPQEFSGHEAELVFTLASSRLKNKYGSLLNPKIKLP